MNIIAERGPLKKSRVALTLQKLYKREIRPFRGNAQDSSGGKSMRRSCQSHEPHVDETRTTSTCKKKRSHLRDGREGMGQAGSDAGRGGNPVVCLIVGRGASSQGGRPGPASRLTQNKSPELAAL